ncbi:hypothetical protein, partial [Escherichia coli]|uniref:hypothetical protein n=1 Tax=Escherichia coli TaxID=562 RepID=UPI0020216D33
MMNPVPWLQMTNMISYQGLVRTFLRLNNATSTIDIENIERNMGNDSNLLIVFYVQIMPDDFVMQLHR